MTWPATRDELVEAQLAIADRSPAPWTAPAGSVVVGGCFVAFARGIEGPGKAGDAAWAAAVLMQGRDTLAVANVEGVAGAPYEAGLLALREGALLEEAVLALPALPDVLLVNGTGRDHPRRCGLAVHLGAVLCLPTIGVTHRPLLAQGAEPANAPGAFSPLTLDEELVGYWLRARSGRRALAVHAGWRTTPETAREIVRGSLGSSRTPEPLRRARELARLARHAATSAA